MKRGSVQCLRHYTSRCDVATRLDRVPATTFFPYVAGDYNSKHFIRFCIICRYDFSTPWYLSFPSILYKCEQTQPGKATYLTSWRHVPMSPAPSTHYSPIPPVISMYWPVRCVLTSRRRAQVPIHVLSCTSSYTDKNSHKFSSSEWTLTYVPY